MKLFSLIILLTVLACSEKEVQKTSNIPQTEVSQTTKTTSVAEANKFESWVEFYKNDNPEFSLEGFKPIENQPFNLHPTSTPASFDGNFNKYYKRFLIYSPDKSKYIDIDSYNWAVAADGNISFEADQEIVLVDLNSKTKNRIAYFGPSYRIEDGYWKNNNEAVLLGNSNVNSPFYIELDFTKNKSQYFQYQDTLKSKSKFREFRLENLV